MQRSRLANIAAAALALGCILPLAAACAANANASIDWRYYGNDLQNERYQNLDQINPRNVSKLQPAWVFHTGEMKVKESFEASPLMVNGTVYVSTGDDTVFALDAQTGHRQWVYRPNLPPLSSLPICCGQDSRGVAYGGGRIFLARLDGMLVALNASTGEVQWRATVASWRQGYSLTMAPQYIDGKVIVGVSGGEYGIRGRVTAYDADTGRVAWTFYTIKPGSSWAGDSAAHGGVPVWGNPTVDARRGLVYVTTGNASPDFDGSARAGNNLYAASVVALDVSTGREKWYFQEVHHDVWDYDGPAPAMLFPVHRHGQTIPALGHCDKGGQYFILDRRDGKPVFPVHEMSVPQVPAWQHASPTQPVSSVQTLTPIGLVNPPSGYGYDYQPYFTPPNPSVPVEQPGTEAGCEWPPAAFSPRTGDIYYGARYEPTGFQGHPGEYHPLGTTQKAVGSAFVRPLPGIHYYGYFGATNADTGRIVWKRRLSEAPLTGPAVAGDLVFYGETDGKVHAVDAKTGRNLWTFDVPREIRNGGGSDAAFSVYEAGGREYVISVFGGSSMERHLKQYSPVGDAVIAFALPKVPGSDADDAPR